MTIENLCIHHIQSIESYLILANEEELKNLKSSASDSQMIDELWNICNIYHALFNGLESGEVCYESEKNLSKQYEKNLKSIIYLLGKIRTNIPRKIKNFPLKLRRLSHEDGSEIAIVSTTYCRELLYCYEYASTIFSLSKFEKMSVHSENM